MEHQVKPASYKFTREYEKEQTKAKVISFLGSVFYTLAGIGLIDMIVQNITNGETTIIRTTLTYLFG